MRTRIEFERLTKRFGAFTALNAIDGVWEGGQSIGVVGANGAGKSTLLRLISGISAPTSGRIHVQGRLASLLEVGTGFHPELTGRENIFLYGQILGLKRAEIRAQFDAIVDFSGVAEQIDLPLKHYSSGQKIRLGFSVAAQLQSDVLVLDEVLGIGDAAFQQQSFERMQSLMREEGRLVVVVSHHLGTVRRLCTHGYWLEAGKVKQSGDIQSVLEAYQGRTASTSDDTAFASDPWIRSVRWMTPPVAGQPAELQVGLRNPTTLQRPNLRLTLFNQNGEFLAPLSPVTSGTPFTEMWPAEAIISLRFDRLPLMRGSYHLGIRLTQNDLLLSHHPVGLAFQVDEGLFFPGGDTFAPRFNGVWLNPDWSVAASDDVEAH